MVILFCVILLCCDVFFFVVFVECRFFFKFWIFWFVCVEVFDLCIGYCLELEVD